MTDTAANDPRTTLERHRLDLGDHSSEVLARGSGEPMVLIHSLGLDQRMWDAVAQRLVSEGRQVFTYDVRGHGTAHDAPPSEDIGVLAADLGEVISLLDLERPALIGTSMGGVIGQKFAADDPEAIRSLGLVASPAAGVAAFEERARAGANGLHELFDDTLERWFGEGYAVDDPGPRYAMGCLEKLTVDHWQGSWRALASFDPPPADLDAVPTVLIAGELDTSTPASVMQMIIDRGSAGGRSVAVVPDAPHLLVLTHPDAVADALRRTRPVPTAG